MQKQNKKTQKVITKSTTSKQLKIEQSDNLKKNEQIYTTQSFNPTTVLIQFKRIYESKCQKEQLLSQSRRYADEIYQIRHNIKNLQDYSKLLKKQIEQLLQMKQSKQKNINPQELTQTTFFEQTPEKIRMQQKNRFEEKNLLFNDYSDEQDCFDNYQNVKTSLQGQQYIV